VSRSILRLVGCAFLLLTSSVVFAYDVWAFRFVYTPYARSWHDDLIFHNATGEDAAVRLLGVSNGTVLPDAVRDIPVSAGRTVSLWNHMDFWQADSYPNLWVVHVDVPDGVSVTSRGGLNSQCPSPCTYPPNPYPDLGAFSMPVFRQLVEPDRPQLHMGTDLGTEPSRFNVGIYNAGAVEAHATISVFQACDDVLLETRGVTIPPNTAVQPSGFGSVKPTCAGYRPGENPWLRYATVVVDQPSVSYAFNVAEDSGIWPKIPFGSALGF
jgi:hypothetical protein